MNIRVRLETGDYPGILAGPARPRARGTGRGRAQPDSSSPPKSKPRVGQDPTPSLPEEQPAQKQTQGWPGPNP
eukprot:649031-Pyramimonas_sp.AAC.1